MGTLHRRQAGVALLALSLALLPDRPLLSQPAFGPVAWDTDPNGETIRAARSALVAENAEARRAGQPELLFRAARVDLNGDRRPELFVLLDPDQACGTRGCNLRLYRPEGSRFVLLNTWDATSATVLQSRIGGWQDIRLDTGQIYRWTGRLYAP